MRKDPLLIQAIQLLSMRVAALPEFGALFSESSCLDGEEREIIGYCEAFISMFPKDPLSIDLKKVYIPALVKIGLAKWRRTELTHLGGKLANKETEEILLTEAENPPEVSYADSKDSETET